MNLDDYCKSLSRPELLLKAIKICERGLPIWEDYYIKNKLEYIDTVVGISHRVREGLLYDSIRFAHRQDFDAESWEYDFNNLSNEFIDPISSIQNSDWKLPYDVEKLFFSIYNLLKGIKVPIGQFDEQTHYISINQAADAIIASGLMNLNQIKEIIYE